MILGSASWETAISINGYRSQKIRQKPQILTFQAQEVIFVQAHFWGIALLAFPNTLKKDLGQQGLLRVLGKANMWQIQGH